MRIVPAIIASISLVSLMAVSAIAQQPSPAGSPQPSPAVSPEPGAPAGDAITVDCSAGDRLEAALGSAQPGSSILITGTCTGTAAVLTLDDLTLQGQGEAVLEGNGEDHVLLVDGARRLVLRGLTIQGGSGGILAEGDATLTVEDTLVRDNQAHGIEVLGVTAEFTRVESRDNGRVGILGSRGSTVTVTDVTLEGNLNALVVFSNATARLFGENSLSGSTGQGVSIGLGGSVFSIGSTLHVNDNAAEGVFLIQDGHLQLTGGRLEAHRNGADGLRLLQSSSARLGIEEFDQPGEVSLQDNAGNGLNIESGSDVAFTEATQLTSQGNGAAGVRLDEGSRATLRGATVDGNEGPDLDVRFDSLATVQGGDVQDVQCSGGARVREDASCP